MLAGSPDGAEDTVGIASNTVSAELVACSASADESTFWRCAAAWALRPLLDVAAEVFLLLAAGCAGVSVNSASGSALFVVWDLVAILLDIRLCLKLSIVQALSMKAQSTSQIAGIRLVKQVRVRTFSRSPGADRHSVRAPSSLQRRLGSMPDLALNHRRSTLPQLGVTCMQI